MRLLRLLYIPVLLVVISCDPDTSSSPEPEDVFVKLYGNLGQETAADFLVRRDADNNPLGFVIFGTTNSAALVSGTGTDTDYYLISTDPAGNETPSLADANTFSEAFDYSYDILDPQDRTVTTLDAELSASKIIQTQDGGYLLVGTALNLIDQDDDILDPTVDPVDLRDDQFVNRAYLVKVDVTGAEEWSILYPSLAPNNGTTKSPTEESSEIVSDVIQTSDGNILLIGSTTNINTSKPDLPDPSVDPSDIWLLKFDPTGLTTGSTDLPVDNITYERVLGFPGEDDGVAVFERSDGSLVIIGNGQGKSDGTDRDILFITSDADAFNNNFQEIGGPNGEEDFVNDVVLLSDGGVAVVGYSTTANGDRTLLARFDQTGGLAFFENIMLVDEVMDLAGEDPLADFIDFTGDHRGYGVTQIPGDNLAVVGELLDVDVDISGVNNQANREIDIILLTTDGFGQHDENSVAKNFGGVNNDIGRSIQQINDIDGTSRFVILSTVDFEGGSTMISLMKTSSSGNLIR